MLASPNISNIMHYLQIIMLPMLLPVKYLATSHYLTLPFTTELFYGFGRNFKCYFKLCVDHFFMRCLIISDTTTHSKYWYYKYVQLLGGGGENILSPPHFSYWGGAAPPRPPAFYASAYCRVCSKNQNGQSVTAFLVVHLS